MKKINIKKGFTLIELLVVVAIIGLLASVILASLNSARNKGGDSAIKSNLANIRPQAEIIYSTAGCYGDDSPPGDTACTAFALNTCTNVILGANTLFANTTVWSQITAAANSGPGLTACYSSGQAWAVAVQLKTSDGAPPGGGPAADSWCVDSTGASKSYAWGPLQTITNSINGTSCR